MDPSADTLALARELIERPSVTPDDGGCQPLLAERLGAAGFTCESLPFGAVANLWAARGGEGPMLVLAGHTDVVPPGPSGAWHTPPFEPVVDNGTLCGRGAADMKGSLAALVVAAERFVRAHPQHGGQLAFLLTSDEEGPARDGTRRVMETLTARGIRPDWCLVGEPSSSETVADTLRRGRRGSLTAYLTVRGTQGHVAYPEFADNPIHRAPGCLNRLVETRWDEGQGDFPPTSFQIVKVEAGAGADNVIPGELTVHCNWRYSPATSREAIQKRVEAVLDDAGLDYDLRWHLSGVPFYTEDGRFLEAVTRAVADITRHRPALSTGGGTSDGRFIAPAGVEVVELGPVNATIHRANECVSVADLETLTRIYQRVFERLLGETA